MNKFGLPIFGKFPFYHQNISRSCSCWCAQAEISYQFSQLQSKNIFFLYPIGLHFSNTNTNSTFTLLWPKPQRKQCHLPPHLTTCGVYFRLAVVLTSSYWPGTVLSLVVVIISCPHHLPVSGSPQCWPCCSCSWWPCWSPHPWASPPALASLAIAQNHSLAMSVMWSVMWGGTMYPFVRLE